MSPGLIDWQRGSLQRPSSFGVRCAAAGGFGPAPARPTPHIVWRECHERNAPHAITRGPRPRRTTCCPTGIADAHLGRPARRRHHPGQPAAAGSLQRSARGLRRPCEEQAADRRAAAESTDIGLGLRVRLVSGDVRGGDGLVRRPRSPGSASPPSRAVCKADPRGATAPRSAPRAWQPPRPDPIKPAVDDRTRQSPPGRGRGSRPIPSLPAAAISPAKALDMERLPADRSPRRRHPSRAKHLP